MKVLFDDSIFLQQRFGGISKYFLELINHMDHTAVEPTIFAPIFQCEYIQNLKPHTNCISHIRKPDMLPRSVASVINRGLSITLGTDFDVVHETYFAKNPILSKSNVPRVITVYDLIHEIYASDFGLDKTSSRKKSAIERSDHIIAISENTKNDLINYYDVSEEKISTVYLGVDQTDNNQIGAKLGFDYILYVGERGGYKNFCVLLEAYASSDYLKSNFKLIAFGGGKFTAVERSKIDHLGCDADKVIQMAGNDEILSQVYLDAAVFVYPSRYEGFGLPPLEAMRRGCPVVVANSGSIPEVVGDAGSYFDPSIADELVQQLEQVLNDSEFRQTLIDRGMVRSGLFSWNRCAKQTLEVYGDVL